MTDAVGIGKDIVHVLLQHFSTLLALLLIFQYFLDEVDCLVAQTHLSFVLNLRNILIGVRDISETVLLVEESDSEAEVYCKFAVDLCFVAVESEEQLNQLVESDLYWIAVSLLLLQLNVAVGSLAAAAVEVVDVLFDQGATSCLHSHHQLLRAGHLVVSEEESEDFETELHGAH